MKIKDKIVTHASKMFRCINGNFFSFWLRPARAKDVQCQTYARTLEKIGIIIQGGVFSDFDFTLETVRLYKKHYPDACIVVSTWHDTPEEFCNQVKKEGADIVLTKRPPAIQGNGNLQIISTQEGIKWLKKKGCKYICKTRSDQRMYAPNIFPYLLKMLESFPCGMNCDLHGRIVVLGSNTYRNRIYDINDMFTFGYASDIEKYWSCPPNMNPDIFDGLKIDSKELITENIICAHFLVSLGFKLKWTIDDSIYYYSKLFIIIDKQSIDLYFVKRFKEYFNSFYYDSNNLVEFSFRDWMALQ